MDISKLDPKTIKVPLGYKVIIDPEIVEKEKCLKEQEELTERLKAGEPGIEELAEFGKMFHPYYQDVARLNQLKQK